MSCSIEININTRHAAHEDLDATGDYLKKLADIRSKRGEKERQSFPPFFQTYTSCPPPGSEQHSPKTEDTDSTPKTEDTDSTTKTEEVIHLHSLADSSTVATTEADEKLDADGVPWLEEWHSSSRKIVKRTKKWAQRKQRDEAAYKTFLKDYAAKKALLLPPPPVIDPDELAEESDDIPPPAMSFAELSAVIKIAMARPQDPMSSADLTSICEQNDLPGLTDLMQDDNSGARAELGQILKALYIA